MAFHTQNNQSSNLSTILSINDTCYPWEDYIENQSFQSPAFKEGAMKLPDIEVFAEAAGMKKKEDESSKAPMEPLPEIPKFPMTVDQAYDFLGVKKEDHGNLDKVKMRFDKEGMRVIRLGSDR